MLGHQLHHGAGNSNAAYATAPTHQSIDQYGNQQCSAYGQRNSRMEQAVDMSTDKWKSDQGQPKQCHVNSNGLAMAGATNEQWSVKGAEKCSNRPAAVEPAITNRSSLQNAITERRRDYALRQHSPDKERPAQAHKQ